MGWTRERQRVLSVSVVDTNVGLWVFLRRPQEQLGGDPEDTGSIELSLPLRTVPEELIGPRLGLNEWPYQAAGAAQLLHNLDL